MNLSKSPSPSITVWLSAARPRTLVAAFAPVALASALAAREDSFSFWVASLCFLFAVLIQIATNFANDYFDFLKGADTERRVGPIRATSAGLVTPTAMRNAAMLMTLLALVTGLLLLPYGNLWMLPIGFICLLLAWGYTGGPYPLAYNGLGDLFVLIFFGWVAVGLTYFLQTGQYAWPAFLAGTSCGLLAANLLLVNNLRDEATDRISSKRTLVVRFGGVWGRLQYGINGFLALGAWAVIAFILSKPLLWVGLLLFIPFVLTWKKVVKAPDPKALAATLPPTAVSLLLVALGGSILLIFN